ncbi:hypothetical protein BDV26DRAFT_112961 [Aspergillus bertholletiae]|uniref:Uncharacterized protein n=1 Tax=Aspergillus bertholletiae TaxID=1226010 RepID=A0A5N7AQF3_9EURO|nr:hypothetical protein BDV26DRAFT_112961 [Aspergillus bertholletiae]
MAVWLAIFSDPPTERDPRTEYSGRLLVYCGDIPHRYSSILNENPRMGDCMITNFQDLLTRNTYAPAVLSCASDDPFHMEYRRANDAVVVSLEEPSIFLSDNNHLCIHIVPRRGNKNCHLGNHEPATATEYCEIDNWAHTKETAPGYSDRTVARPGPLRASRSLPVTVTFSVPLQQYCVGWQGGNCSSSFICAMLCPFSVSVSSSSCHLILTRSSHAYQTCVT